jgi:hypothetical protein
MKRELLLAGLLGVVGLGGAGGCVWGNREELKGLYEIDEGVEYYSCDLENLLGGSGFFDRKNVRLYISPIPVMEIDAGSMRNSNGEFIDISVRDSRLRGRFKYNGLRTMVKIKPAVESIQVAMMDLEGERKKARYDNMIDVFLRDLNEFARGGDGRPAEFYGNVHMGRYWMGLETEKIKIGDYTYTPTREWLRIDDREE